MPQNVTRAIKTVSVTVSGTAVTMLSAGFFTQAQLDLAEILILTPATGSIRLRYDGIAPTASVGHHVAVDQNYTITGRVNISNLQVIKDTGTNSDLTVTIEGYTVP